MDSTVEAQFTEFVRHRGHALFRVAYSLCGQQQAAEDLVQNALAKMVVKWRSISGEPEHYVRRILYRDFVSSWRHRVRRPEWTVASVPERESPGDPADRAVTRLALMRLLAPRAEPIDPGSPPVSSAPTESAGVTPPAVTHRRPSVTEPPVALPGGWIVGGGSGQDQPWIFDRVQGRYHTVPYYRAIPAPVGELVLVEKQDGWAGVLDVRTNQVRRLATAGSGWSLGVPEWSADGRRLLRITDNGKIFVTDAGTGTSQEIRPEGGSCELCNSAVWLPGDQEFALYDSNRLGAQATVYAIADGRRLRTMPWKPGARTAFSPSGERVFTEDGIVDVATGQLIAPIAGINDYRVVYWTEPDRILVIDHGGVTVYSAGGARIGTFPWPAEFVDDELPNFTLVKQG